MNVTFTLSKPHDSLESSSKPDAENATTSDRPGLVVDLEPDTEDITLLGIDPAAEAWERLADVYAAGELCPGCMWHESGTNPHNGLRWRECSCFAPDACPGVNPRSIANALRRQAS